MLPTRAPFRGRACLPERAVRRAPKLRRSLGGRPRIRPHVDAADIERLKADAVLKCSGAEPGVTAALAAARPDGTAAVVGGARESLDPLTILIKELRVQGSFTYVDEFAAVISLLTDGALQVADLTSEIASIDEALAAFE